MRLLRLGAILGNYAIFGAVLLLLLGMLPAATFIFFFIAAVIVALIAIVWLLTLGQLFAFPDTSLFDSSGPIFEALSKFAHACAPYLFTITAVFAIASLIIAVLDKQKHVGRIVCSSIALGFAVIGMILVYTVGGITL